MIAKLVSKRSPSVRRLRKINSLDRRTDEYILWVMGRPFSLGLRISEEISLRMKAYMVRLEAKELRAGNEIKINMSMVANDALEYYFEQIDQGKTFETYRTDDNSCRFNPVLKKETYFRVKEYSLSQRLKKLEMADKEAAAKIFDVASDIVMDALNVFIDVKEKEISDELASKK